LNEAAYQILENSGSPSDHLNEWRFELGLHHNRKYEHSNRLFNELASQGFDKSRIDGW
jgi:hypothetical protein